jgi:FMN phosphatase YigB (HAD superfamily)
MQKPRFLYFDLGNVLLTFDHQLACRQMGQAAGLAAERVWDVMYAGDLAQRYEAGEFGDREFYDIFCRQTDTRPDYHALLLAGSAIFTPNVSIYGVVNGLMTAGHRMGILSNTCPAHWAYCYPLGYAILARGFEVYALSYELKACKPSPRAYEAAAALAGVAASEIFYVDDIAGHVAAARQAGFDAVQYTTTPALVGDLRARGIELNY